MVHHPSFVYHIVTSYMNISKIFYTNQIGFVAGKLAKNIIFWSYSLIIFIHNFNKSNQNDIVH